MRKLFVSGIMLWVGVIFMCACEVEAGDPKVAQTDSAWKVFEYVEDDVESVVELFENVLRLNQEIQQGEMGKNSKYFAGETIFCDSQGWWGVTDWNGCRFKVFPKKQDRLTTRGAQWIALSKYYTNDSLFIENIGENQWLVEGFTKGSNNWCTEISCRISFTGEVVPDDLDAVALELQGNGVTWLSENYPASDIKITFSTPRPLLRKDKATYRSYPFMGGTMQIQMKDLRKDRKEQVFVEIEDLPLEERMVRITTRGVTEIH